MKSSGLFSLSRLVSVSLVSMGLLAGCGGGGEVYVEGGSGGDLPVVNIRVSAVQIAAGTVQVTWDDDPAAAFFRVRGEGRPLADVDAVTYIDTTVFAGYQYCYDVAGYTSGGRITAVSNVVCLTVL
jgi:hypothetical protein